MAGTFPQPKSEEYVQLEKIGSGTFGTVYKVRRKSDGLILCRKEINYGGYDSQQIQKLETEVQILQSLQHPNIVRCYGAEVLKEHRIVYIYMEFCGRGDLEQLINRMQKQQQQVNEDDIWHIFAQLAAALYRCHNGSDAPVLGIVTPDPGPGPAQPSFLHRDLKPANILFADDGTVKLSDFGLSKFMSQKYLASSHPGTPYYMSPEIWAKKSYSYPSDIWALGCSMYHLSQLRLPFDAQTLEMLHYKIQDSSFKLDALPRVYSDSLKDLIARCLRRNPDERPDSCYLLNEPRIRLARAEDRLRRIEIHLPNTCNITEHRMLSRQLREYERRFALEAQRKTSQAPIEVRASSRDKAVQANADWFIAVADKGGDHQLKLNTGASGDFKAHEWLLKMESLSFILRRLPMPFRVR